MLPSIEVHAGPGRFLAAAMIDVTDFCCILEHALSERDAGRGPLTERLGLAGADLRALRDRWFPYVELPDLDLPGPATAPDQNAIRTLALWKGGSGKDEAHWLAAILARRALEPNHLWEDMGLANRTALSALIKRFLPGLTLANRQNMRWKRFFYRQICADEGFSLCMTPNCSNCPERSDCFDPD